MFIFRNHLKLLITFFNNQIIFKMSLNSAALCTANHFTHDVRLVCQLFLSLQVSIHTPVLYLAWHITPVIIH